MGRIKNSIQLLAEMQHIAGTRKAFIISKTDLAKAVGLSTWNPMLQTKLDKLCNKNRISVTNLGKRTGYRIEILKPLASEEISDLTLQNNDDKTIDVIASIQNTNNDICKKIEQNITNVKDAEDIDNIFDEIGNLTNGLITKCRNLHEENVRLKTLNETLLEREKKWMTRATLYRQQIK